MKVSKGIGFAALLGIVVTLGLLFCASARAQDGGRVNVGIDYNYVRTNAPPGGCGCIDLHGGDGWLSFNFTRHVAVVGLVSGQRATDIEGSGTDLTLTTFVVGPRYSFEVGRRVAPFAQVLVGGAHASRFGAGKCPDRRVVQRFRDDRGRWTGHCAESSFRDSRGGSGLFHDTLQKWSERPAEQSAAERRGCGSILDR